MFLSLFTRRLASGLNATLRHAGMRLFSDSSNNSKPHCPASKPCIMEYPKNKCQTSECLTKEPSCPLAFEKCPPAKQIPQLKSDCCASERLASNPCNFQGARDQGIKKDIKLVNRMETQTGTWEYPAECCGNPCPDLAPSFDSLYYIPSDKAKREYQQTWVECPALQLSKRKVCCYDPTELPPICRRKKSECPLSACEFDSRKMKALCSLSSKSKCAYIPAPCCIRGRYPPTCRISKTQGNCQRKCCPYPSFSECCHPCFGAKKRNECDCSAVQSNCVIYRYLKRKLIYDIPPPLPAWPPRMQGPR